MSGHEQPRADNDDLLTPDKVAALLAVSVRSVRRYSEEGRLTPVRIGRNVRYRLADVDRLIAEGMQPNEADTGQEGHRTPDTGYGGQWQPQADTPPLSAREPLEAAYRVTPAEIEQAVSRTSAQYMGDLRTMLAEVGKVYEGQLVAKDAALAAKDETITTQREALATQGETVAEQRAALAELRRRAEQAEAERDRLAAAQAAQDAPGAPIAPTPDSSRPDAPGGFWARVRRMFAGARA
jgi:excisionase family DNA binding protein